ncbi:MAG: RNA recognition motif domain-containing protein [Myxococcota bacterium]
MRKREEGPGDVPLTTAEEVTGDLPPVDEAMRAMKERAEAPKGASAVPCRLFVGSLSWDATEDDLRAVFGEHGEVTDAFIVNDRDTGKSRGFGFVTMAKRKEAMKAIEALNDTEIQGRRIVVNIAENR